MSNIKSATQQEDSTETEEINQEEFDEYQHNVEDLEKKLLLRKQQHTEWNMFDFNGVEFDLNLYLGLEKAPVEKNKHASTFTRRIDTLIQEHFGSEKSRGLDDVRKVLPIFSRKDTLPPSRVPLLVSIQFHCNGKHISKSLIGARDVTPDTLITQFFSKITSNKSFGDLDDTNPKSWTFKIIGSAQYMYGQEFKLGEYEFIQEAIQKGLKKVDIALISAVDAIGNSSVLIDTVLSSIDIDREYVRQGRVSYDYDEIKAQMNPSVIPLWDQTGPVFCKIVSMGDVNAQNLSHIPYLTKVIDDPMLNEDIIVEFDILYGDTKLSDHGPKYTNPIKLNCAENLCAWNQNLVFVDLLLHDLPRESIAQIIVYHRVSAKGSAEAQSRRLDSDIPIFIVRFPLIEEDCALVSGRRRLKLWPIEPGTAPTKVSTINQFDSACSITLEFSANSTPVVYTERGTLPKHLITSYAQYQMKMTKKYPNVMNDIVAELGAIINSDSLYEMNEREKWRMFHFAKKIQDNPKALSKYLLSVPWKYPKAAQIARGFLRGWKKVATINALELLDTRYADSDVRQYAINILSELPDDQFNLFLLQLVQCLKNEIYHDTPLARLLIERALRSTHQIGHSLFWSLKAELHNSQCKERFILIIEEYLKAANSHRIQLTNQITLVNYLLEFALKVKRYQTKSVQDRKVYFQDLLKDFQFKKCVLPLNPRMEVTNLIIDRCKVMGSKKLPLWLVFENTDDTEGGRLPIIFKAGDDIRQDSLTLQLLSIMDNLWRNNSLNLHMKIYGCVSCGDMNGFIEVVQKSETIANITNEYGGSSAVFKREPLEVWLKQQTNPTDAEWKITVDNFARSVSAYCVATYVLGIGDRHNDNIMLQECGDLFHIDFGHFLGNYKKKLGIKRENAAFVFTNMYSHVLNGFESEQFALFKQLSCEAYNMIRKNGDLIMNLLRLMIGTGIPELQRVEDVSWVQKCITAGKTEEEATDHFINLIHASHGNARTKIMEYTHILSQNIKK